MRLTGIDKFISSRLCSVAGSPGGQGGTGGSRYPGGYDSYSEWQAAGSPTDDKPGGTVGEEVGGAIAGMLPPTSNHHTPAGHHGGGGDSGLDEYRSLFEDMMAQYDELIQGLLNPETPEGPEPGGGFGDTVLTRSVILDEENRTPSLFAIRNPQTGGAPQNQVFDPITGQMYANPAAALRAGVTNYRYQPIPAVSQSAPAPGGSTPPATTPAVA